MSFYQSKEVFHNGYVALPNGRLYEHTTEVTKTTYDPVPSPVPSPFAVSIPVSVPVSVNVPVYVPVGFGYSSSNIQVAQIQQSHADVLNARAGLRGGPSYYTICGNCGNRPGGCRYCPRS